MKPKVRAALRMGMRLKAVMETGLGLQWRIRDRVGHETGIGLGDEDRVKIQ